MAGSSLVPETNGTNQNEDDGELVMYKKQALNVVSFKFIYGKDDLDGKDFQFKPIMAHQVFGDSECIFGYKSLAINLYYSHNSVQCFTDIQARDKINETDMYEADDIKSALDSWLPANYTDKRETFIEVVENESHDKMYGTLVGEFTTNTEVHLFPNQKIQPAYKVMLADNKDPEFVLFHQNFETLIVWFIDAANFIDIEDEKWMIFYVYEEFTHPKTKQLYRTPVGYCTVYKFFSYPEKVRTRVSQFFILPTHQKRGIGSQFYDSVIRKIRDMPNVVDMTVEEPTRIFQKMRECSDCKIIYKHLKDNGLKINTLHTKKMDEIFKRFKICKREGQRVLDLLGCYKAKQCGPFEYNNFLETVKSRITKDCEKDAKVGKRFHSLPGYIPDPIDTKPLIESEFKRYIDEITPSVKYLMAILK